MTLPGAVLLSPGDIALGVPTEHFARLASLGEHWACLAHDGRNAIHRAG